MRNTTYQPSEPDERGVRRCSIRCDHYMVDEYPSPWQHCALSGSDIGSEKSACLPWLWDQLRELEGLRAENQGLIEELRQSRYVYQVYTYDPGSGTHTIEMTHDFEIAQHVVNENSGPQFNCFIQKWDIGNNKRIDLPSKALNPDGDQ